MITLRKGTVQDAPFIATMVMMALHIDKTENQDLYHRMVEIVEDDYTLYSWHRCCIAMDNDVCVGLCLAYDAEDYHERRARTFSMKCRDGKSFGDENHALLEQEDEAGEGEYYIDSLAVVASHRRHGIGRMLLSHAITEAGKQNLRPTLLVDPDNPNAIKLYSSLGFEYKKDSFVFGQVYHKYEYGK